MARRRVLQFRTDRREKPARIDGRLAHAFSQRGRVAWRLIDELGALQVCDIQSPETPHDAWQVVLWLDDVPQFTRVCAGQDEAEFVARSLMEDQLLGGAQPVGLLRAMR